MSNQTASSLRYLRLAIGLALFGVGLGLVVLGDFGLPPWDIFHQGLAEQTSLTIGIAMIFVGAALLIALVLLKEPMGVGTIGQRVRHRIGCRCHGEYRQYSNKFTHTNVVHSSRTDRRRNRFRLLHWSAARTRSARWAHDGT